MKTLEPAVRRCVPFLHSLRLFTFFGLWAFLFLALAALPAQAAGDDTDFDDDGQDDYVVYRKSPLEGYWFILSPKSGVVREYQWGLAGDIPVPGQYIDNLRPDLAVYRPSNGNWYIRQWDQTLEFATNRIIQWGGFSADIPVPCDYNADSRQDIAIYRGGQWFIIFSQDFDPADAKVYTWGNPTDQPVPRDFDGDNRCDLAVWRASAASFFVLLSSKNYQESATVALGSTSSVPVPGFYDGDNLSDFAVYTPGTPSTWTVLESSSQRLTRLSIPWGTNGDTPLAADIDGDTDLDIIVWRPSEGSWYLLKSSGDFGSAVFQPFGLPNTIGVDVPIGQVRAPASYR